MRYNVNPATGRVYVILTLSLVTLEAQVEATLSLFLRETEDIAETDGNI